MLALVRRNVWWIAVVVVALVVGGFVWRQRGDDDPFAGYCSAVESHRDDLGAALSAGRTTGLLRALPSFEDLADKSPQDIRTDWNLVVSRIEALAKALEAAGVEAATYDPAKPPADLSDAEQAAIKKAADALGSAETATALSRVEQQARDVCKTPLSL